MVSPTPRYLAKKDDIVGSERRGSFSWLGLGKGRGEWSRVVLGQGTYVDRIATFTLRCADSRVPRCPLYSR